MKISFINDESGADLDNFKKTDQEEFNVQMLYCFWLEKIQTVQYLEM